MEIVLFAIILIVVLVLRANISDNNTLVKDLKHSVEDLETEIRRLNKRISESEATKVIEKPAAPPPPKPVAPTQAPAATIFERRSETAATPPPPKEETISVVQPPAAKPVYPIVETSREGWFEKWLKNNPDIEKFIGENLINKIGIAVLVLGIAFFVKYAIDQEWINEQGRVGIGVLCGGILIGLAHCLRNSYRSFSSVLVGGGLTVFYFTIAIAFHDYKLIGQTPAFICMVVITAFAVILSVLYERVELAILATIGGFITPFLLSTGQENHIALFTYLAVLNAGLIVLGYFKRWRILNFISLFFTIIIYGAWFTTHLFKDDLPFRDAFVFATIFYFLFLAMNLVSQFSIKDKLKAFDFALLLTINLTYYTAGLLIIKEANMLQYKGIFTASLGVLNLIMAYGLFRSKSLDKNFIYLLIGLTITYISLTAPVQLQGNHITLFWAAEAVLLLWLYQHSFIKLVKLAALLVTICMLFSLLIDWYQVYSFDAAQILPVIINKGVITTVFASASLMVSYRLLRKEADTFYHAPITNSAVRSANAYLSAVLLLIIGFIEINYQFSRRFPATGLNFVYLQLYALSFCTLGFLLAQKMKWKIDEYLRLMITGVLFILYLANASNVYTTEKDILVSGENSIHLFANIFNAIAVTALLFVNLYYLIINRSKYENLYAGFLTLLSIAFVLILSIEIRNLFIWGTYSIPVRINYFENLYSKAILTITWGSSSFIMIWLGMKYRLRGLRITALVLFGVTLIKLFSFDIRNIPPAGKIAAFILLGILLLVVSFMYQRLKKLIIDNAENK